MTSYDQLLPCTTSLTLNLPHSNPLTKECATKHVQARHCSFSFFLFFFEKWDWARLPTPAFLRLVYELLSPRLRVLTHPKFLVWDGMTWKFNSSLTNEDDMTWNSLPRVSQIWEFEPNVMSNEHLKRLLVTASPIQFRTHLYCA